MPIIRASQLYRKGKKQKRSNPQGQDTPATCKCIISTYPYLGLNSVYILSLSLYIFLLKLFEVVKPLRFRNHCESTVLSTGLGGAGIPNPKGELTQFVCLCFCPTNMD